MSSLYQKVKLVADHPPLKAGEAGTIVHIYEKPEKAYLVEFCNERGETIALVPFKAAEITTEFGL